MVMVEEKPRATTGPRLEIRVTEEQQRRYRMAAAKENLNLSRWVLRILDEVANRELSEGR
jgi:uncharacterized protein (DUF1778 family)